MQKLNLSPVASESDDDDDNDDEDNYDDDEDNYDDDVSGHDDNVSDHDYDARDEDLLMGGNICNKNADVPSEDDKEFNNGHHVKIIKGSFIGLYATVTGESYGDEVEIQYFEPKFGKWILRDNDMESREPNELLKVTAKVDQRDRYTFSG